jgi:hypothetical protein
MQLLLESLQLLGGLALAFSHGGGMGWCKCSNYHGASLTMGKCDGRLLTPQLSPQRMLRAC